MHTHTHAPTHAPPKLMAMNALNPENSTSHRQHPNSVQKLVGLASDSLMQWMPIKKNPRLVVLFARQIMVIAK